MSGGAGGRTPGRIGVLLVNTGTPAAPRPREVRSYLGKFLMDKRIAPMNRIVWWLILHLFILPRRGVASAQKYAQIWTDEGSSFARAHAALERAVEERLREEGFDAAVRRAMSYSDPSIPTALRELKDAGCARLVVLPLYPQSASSTVGAVRDGVARAVRRVRWQGPVALIDGYCDCPTYSQALAASARHAGFGQEEGDRIIFSYHSIPVEDVEAGDPYELQAGATSLAVAGELGLERAAWTIGYQCQFDKGRTWLSPFTKDILSRWAEVGGGRTFVMCPIFPVDCLETLYDVEREFGPHYLAARRAAGHPTEAGDFVYVPCLNATRAHMRVLCDVLRPHLEGREA